MDIFWSIALLVGIFLAFNMMAGGRSSSVLRPACRIVENLLSFALRAVLNFVGSVLKIGAGSVKLPKSGAEKDNGPAGPPPPRWDK